MNERPSALFVLASVLALAGFGLGYGEWLWIGCCLALVLASLFGARRGVRLPGKRALAFLLGAAWLVAIVYYIVVIERILGAHPIGRRMWAKPWVVASVGLVASAALALVIHARIPRGRKSALVALLSGLVMMAGGNFYHPTAQYVVVLCLYLAVIVGAVALGGGGQGEGEGLAGRIRTRWAALSLVVLLLVGFSAVMLTWSLRLMERAVWMLTAGGLTLDTPDFINTSAAGGSMDLERHSRLRLGSTIIATVESENRPGYLRTQVLTKYDAGRWRPGLGKAITIPGEPVGKGARYAIGPPAPIAARDVPAAANGAAPAGGSAAVMRVSLLANMRGTVPLPYEAFFVGTDRPVAFSVVEGRAVSCETPALLIEYEAGVGPSRGGSEAVAAVRPGEAAAAPEGSPSEMEVALEIPSHVGQALRPVAEGLFGGETLSPPEAARRIRDFFLANFTYSRDVDLSDQGDPIVDFVLNRRPAYCEYFASGMVLMLRSIGVPARVAGGYAVEEFNDVGDDWLVRKSDAHAWCEVYDAASGMWIAYDPTPAAGDEGGWAGSFLGVRHLFDWGRVRIEQAVVRFGSIPLREQFDKLAEAVGRLLSKPVLIAAAAAVALYGLIRFGPWSALRRLVKRLRRGRAASAPAPAAPPDDGSEEVRTLFLEGAALLARLGLPMRADETVEAYLRRFPDAVGALPRIPARFDPACRAFLTTYAAARFRPGEPARRELASRLQAGLAELQRTAARV